MPYYLTKSRGYTSDYTAAILATYDIGGTGGSFVLGALSDYMTTRFLLITPFVCLSGPFILLIFITYDIWLLIIITILTGIIISATDRILTSAVCIDLAESNDHDHDLKGTVTGIINGLGAVGAAFGQFLVASN